MMMIENIKHALFEYFQDSPACRCKSCMNMKNSIEYWRTDIDKAEPQYSETTPFSASTCPPWISHGMVRDWNRAFAMTERRVSTRNCTSHERQLALITNFNQLMFLKKIIHIYWRSQWPRGLRRWSAAAHLLRSWVRIPPEACIFVCCECCVLSGRGLCDELITRPEESYRLWCVVLCDLETSRIRRPWHALGRSATGEKNI